VTLTDVMRGIYKQRIITKLPEELFTFLVGIIQEHNEVGFKDDFDMTNGQAMAAGGGNNRQSVKRRRDALAKFKIDGTPILVVKGGNRGKNTCCKYQINYDLICRYNGIWSKEKQAPSQKYNSSRDDGDTRGVTMGDRETDARRDYPKTRSEEVREENNNYDMAPPPENEDEERHDKITDALKKAIGGDPNAITLVSNNYQREAFGALMEYPDEKILHVIQVSGEKGKLHQDNAITYTKNGLEKYGTWYAQDDGGNVGAGQTMGERDRIKAAEVLAHMKEELADLESRTTGDWSDAIAGQKVAIAEAEVG